MQNRFAKKKRGKKKSGQLIKNTHCHYLAFLHCIYIFVGVIWKNGYKKSQIQIMQQQCVL